MYFWEADRQGYYLFEFQTILAVRNQKKNDFRSFKKIPYEVEEEENRKDKAYMKQAKALR